MVEGAGLENRYTLTGIVGSNPTLSAGARGTARVRGALVTRGLSCARLCRCSLSLGPPAGGPCGSNPTLSVGAGVNTGWGGKDGAKRSGESPADSYWLSAISPRLAARGAWFTFAYQ